MTLDEKLDNFYKSAINDATNKSVDIINDFKKSLQDSYDEHKNDAMKNANNKLKAESEKLLRDKNKQLSKESIDIKRQLSEKTKEYSDRLFDDVGQKLNEFMKTEDYINLLIKQIKESKDFARDDAFTVYINTSDEGKKDLLEKATGIELTVTTTDFTGGTRTVIHSKNILIDNSFKSKFNEEKDKFILN